MKRGPVGDLRALAAFRVALGALLLLDLLMRVFDLRAFYTDDGVLPRADVLEASTHSWICVHMGTGGPLGAALLFLAGMLCAWNLMVGRRTRLMSALCWLFWNSLSLRGLVINDRGDLELCVMLFWSMFLPLGARWSVDARRHPEWAELPDAYGSAGFSALTLQFALIYAFSALLKNGEAWTRSFDAVRLSFHSALFATRLSIWLSQFESMLRPLTPLTRGLELLIALLILLPWGKAYARLLAVWLLTVLHTGILLTLHLGLFPLIGLTLCWALLPGLFWDGPGEVLARLAARLPNLAPPGQTLPPAYRLGRPEQALVLFSALSCIYGNWCTLPDPGRAQLAEPMRSFARALRLEQHWDLFSPLPPIDAWFVLEATLEDGSRVDLFRQGRPVDLHRPADPWAIFPDHRWRMLMDSTLFPQGQSFGGNLSRYWAREHPAGQRITWLRYLAQIEQPNPMGSVTETRILWQGAP